VPIITQVAKEVQIQVPVRVPYEVEKKTEVPIFTNVLEVCFAGNLILYFNLKTLVLLKCFPLSARGSLCARISRAYWTKACHNANPTLLIHDWLKKKGGAHRNTYYWDPSGRGRERDREGVCARGDGSTDNTSRGSACRRSSTNAANAASMCAPSRLDVRQQK
jgi:hypothetical protein